MTTPDNPIMPGDIVTDEMIARLHEEREALLIALADRRAALDAANATIAEREATLRQIAELAARVVGRPDSDAYIDAMFQIEALARGE